MALNKEIEIDNGMILNYHRITSLNKITNVSNTIEVSSYTTQIQREKEQRYQELQRKSTNSEELTEEEQQLLNNGINIIIETDYVQIPYDKKMTIENAYKYLKTTEKFRNAEDV